MSQESIHTFLDGKTVLSAAEFDVLKRAEAVLEEANTQAASIVAAARREADQIRTDAALRAKDQLDQAQLDGKQTAQAEYARSVATHSAQRAKSMTSLDERIGLLVTRTLAKVLTEREVDEKFFTGVLNKVLRAARDEKFLSVRVCPEQLEAARSAVTQAVSATTAPAFVEVTADPALKRGACLVESEHGIIDASLDTQLEAIRQALTTVWGNTDG